MSELGTISGAALQQYLASARTRGVDTDAALEAAGMRPARVNDPDGRIPGEQLEILLEHLIRASDDPLFGLHTSRFVQPGSYNVMGYIAMSASTVGEALSRVSVYETLVGDMGITETAFRDGLVEVRWNCRHHRQPVRRHLIENVLGSWVRYTRWLADNEELNPEAVLLEHAPPEDATLLDDYRQIFRCEIRFNQPCSALLGSPALLEHRLRQPDPQLLSTLEAHAARKMEALGVGSSLTQKVRDCLHNSLEERLPRKEQVAAELHINTRTMHRRLRAEGSSWREILDDLRQELAREYLRDTDLSQARIAEKLGYSDIRSFQRSFGRRHDLTPGDFRRQHRT